MSRFAWLRGGMQAQIERHLMRRLARAHEPARKSVFVVRCWLEGDLMRAKANVCQRIGNRACRLQLAIPCIHCNSVRTRAERSNDILAAGQPRCNHSLWPLEELVLRHACDHPAIVQYQQIAAE